MSGTKRRNLVSKKILTEMLRKKRNRLPYGFMIPALVLVGFITVYPVFFSIHFSMYEMEFLEKIKFVGLENYFGVLRESRTHQNFFASFVFTFGGVFLVLVCAFFLALLLREKVKINAVYRTLILVPWITNQVTLALMWKWLLNPELGPVTFLLKAVGLPKIDLLKNAVLALIVVTVINIWRAMGFGLVMFLAALSVVPTELEEASLVDGASKLSTIRYIILPLITPAVLVTGIVLTISFFNIMVLVLEITGGGPHSYTELLCIRLYKEGFLYFNYDTAAVLTIIMLTMNLVLAWGYFKLLRSGGYY